MSNFTIDVGMGSAMRDIYTKGHNLFTTVANTESTYPI